MLGTPNIPQPVYVIMMVADVLTYKNAPGHQQPPQWLIRDFTVTGAIKQTMLEKGCEVGNPLGSSLLVGSYSVSDNVPWNWVNTMAVDAPTHHIGPTVILLVWNFAR